jgi:uncharacterized DUF497 family protein
VVYEWHAAKAKANLQKCGVSLRLLVDTAEAAAGPARRRHGAPAPAEIGFE